MAMKINVQDAVSQASLEIGITQTAVQHVFGSKDQDINQMAALLSAVADEVLINEPYKYTLGDQVWVTDVDGNPKIYPSQDTDIIQFDSRLLIDGIKYRFLKAKGLEYGEEMRDFTERMNRLAGRQNARVLDLNDEESRVI